MRGSITRAGTAFALAATLALGAAACGGDDENTTGGTSAEGGGEGAKIALLLPETKTTRYEEQDKPGFEKRVAELCPDCEVLYSNANQDAARQQQQAEQAITNGAKAIVISAVDVQSAAAIVQRANQSNVPVIAYGRLIPDADISHYVSIDPFEVGKQQGEVLLDALKAKDAATGPIVMINGSPTDSNSAPYKRGAHSVLDAAGVRIAKEYDTPDWSPDTAQREMEQAITAVGENGFAGVYSANDGMAGGAIAAMKGAGIDPADRPTTGQDAELAGLQRILAGEQLMTVYQPLLQLSAAAAELAVPLAQGKQPPADLAKDRVDNGAKQVPSVLLPTIAITKDNIAETVIKDGFTKAEDLCTGKYADMCAEAGIQ